MWCYPEIRSFRDIPGYHVRHGRGEKPALMFEGRSVSYDQLERRSNRFANALIARNLPKSSRIAFIGKNSDIYFNFFFGTFKAGHVFLAVNWRLSPGELRDILDDASPQLVIADIEFRSGIEEVRKTLMFNVIYIDPLSEQQPELDEWLGQADESRPDPEILLDDPCFMLYTSGTTGIPKGVTFSNASLNLTQLIVELEPALPFTEEYRLLIITPLFHLLAVNFSWNILYAGGTVSILREADVTRMLQHINTDSPSLLVVAPTVIQMMIDHPDCTYTDFSSLKLLIYAGSPIGLGLLKDALKVMKCNFMQFYGTTENGMCSILRPEEHDLENENRLKSCGKPSPLTHFKIVDFDGNEVVGVDQPGELWVRIPMTFKYWNKPELTAEVMKDGWYKTGDIVVRDAEGFFYIIDRIKDLIITGGENVYAAEVEQALHKHPDVKQAIAIGVPDAKWGEAVKALVILKEGASATAEELISYCQGLIARYKVPKSIEFRNEFPMTATGKVSKQLLRQPYWQDERSAA